MQGGGARSARGGGGARRGQKGPTGPTGADLERASADLLELRNAEDKADRVKDVGLATAVQARDGIELLVKARHHRALGIRLEAIDNDLLNMHGCTPPCLSRELTPPALGSHL